MQSRSFYFRHNRNKIQMVMPLFRGKRMLLIQANLPLYLKEEEWDPATELPVPGHPRYEHYRRVINEAREEYLEVIREHIDQMRVISFKSLSAGMRQPIEKGEELFLDEFLASIKALDPDEDYLMAVYNGLGYFTLTEEVVWDILFITPDLLNRMVVFLHELSGWREEYTVRLFSHLKGYINKVYPWYPVDMLRYIPQIPFVVFLQRYEMSLIRDSIIPPDLQDTRDLFCILMDTGMRFSESQEADIDPEGYISWSSDESRTNTQLARIPIASNLATILRRNGGSIPRMSQNKFDRELQLLFMELDLERKVTLNLHKKDFPDTYTLGEIISGEMARTTFLIHTMESGIMDTEKRYYLG